MNIDEMVLYNNSITTRIMCIKLLTLFSVCREYLEKITNIGTKANKTLFYSNEKSCSWKSYIDIYKKLIK